VLAAPTGPASGSVRPAVTGLPAARDTVFHYRGDQYVELTAAIASIETNMQFFTTKSELVLKGRKASYRVSEREPTFFSVWAPNEAPLVRLKRGDDHDDRNLKISSGAFMPFGGTQKTGVRSEDTVDVDSEKDPRGFYRIKPKKPLEPGEYGFILTQGFATGSGKVFDFGVE
jgi:hypothetical protein